MPDNLITPVYEGHLRKLMVTVPECIKQCSGIVVFGRKIQSLVFSTDVSIIANCNADAVIAVYPFTPQPIITQAVLSASNVPVFTGVGGGMTRGKRVVSLAKHAEFQGATGVVVNAPTVDETIIAITEQVDIPVVVTIVSERDDVASRLKAGASILNVSAAAQTPYLVRKIRKEFPETAIIATGGQTEQSITETIEAGANAITWTPPAQGEIFKKVMEKYRRGEAHD